MPADLGILFVHGIGSQKRGETIVNMGEPLYRALKNWIEAASFDKGRASDARSAKPKQPSSNTRGKVEIVDAVLRPKDRSEPAHVRLRVSTDRDSRPVEWIMAECHWAKSYPPPDHRTVTLWLMRVVPWVWTSFFARRLRMAAGAIGAAMAASPKRWLEAGRLCVSLLTAIIALPLISPLALGLELALTALLIAGLVPLGVVRDFVARINAVISAILGNSFMYASSAMRQQAVISKIRADLDWLESKWACKHLVILGHSQGAALSYLSLKQHFLAKVRLLITFGSGLLKLYQLNDASPYISHRLCMIGQICGEACWFFAGMVRRGVGRRESCLNDIWLRKPRRGLGGPRGDAAWVTRCGGACQAGEARALAAAARLVAAQPQAWAAGHADAIATLMRRTLTRTRAPILSSLRRMVPQVALANGV